MWLNKQETKELTIFQKYVVQNIYIKKLNQWLDELNWELEKKETIIETQEKEIEKLKNLSYKIAVRLEIELKKENVKYSKGKKIIINKL
jgi:hypothetical protein